MAKPNVLTHTAGLSTTMPTAETRPRKPPTTAPRVVVPRQKMLIEQHREIAARRDGERQADHEGDVLLLEDVAEQDRDDADDDGAIFETPISVCSVARPLAKTRWRRGRG